MDRKELRKVANRPIHSNVNDAIEGEKISGIARQIIKLKQPIPGSSRHRIEGAILKTDAFCIVNKEFRLKE